MPKINPRIKSIDDLLGLDAAEERPIEPTPSVSLPTKNTIITLPPQAIRAFRGHPFRLYEGDRLNDLVESISEHGVLNPAIIRKIERDEDGFEYEMLAGHNRQNAAAIANRELPCIVKENLSDEDAWIYVIETNVLQRSFSEMLPSEKAAVLTLRYSKMICQGRRNDIVEELKRLESPDEIRENGTCGIECHKSKSRDVVGAEYDLKGRAVANYLRINELITPLKRRIDDAEFPIVVAVQLSYLTEQEQQMVDDVLSESEYKVNEGKVVLLREYTGKLTPERTEQILSGEFNRKPKKSTATAFKVKPAIYKKYFTASISQKEFDSIVDEALALYYIILRGALLYGTDIGNSGQGTITRIENLAERIPNYLEDARRELKETQKQLAVAQQQVGQPFLYEEELSEKVAQLTEINTKLEFESLQESEVILDENGQRSDGEEDWDSERVPACASAEV